MIISRQSLQTLGIGYKANFQDGFDGLKPSWGRIATEVKSTTGTEEYGWLGQLPGMREWIGERQIKNIMQHGYAIKNRPFEMTVSVPRPAIEDDNHGVYGPLMKEMGRSAAEHPDILVYSLLKAGFATLCYDGQNYFDTDHPVVGANGSVTSVSNMQAGGGAAWFLMDTRRALKPLIYQNRKKAEFISKDNPSDENVFMKNEFVYGADSRGNVGFGFWQIAFGSKATLDEANLQAAYTAMTSLKGDEDRPLGIKPDLLVVHPTLVFTAKKLVAATTLANGAENIMANMVDIHDSPWLA
jgi:phage major head subunit gpT-like protein